MLRFNNAPTLGFERHVGGRTDFRLVEPRFLRSLLSRDPYDRRKAWRPSAHESMLVWSPYAQDLYVQVYAHGHTAPAPARFFHCSTASGSSVPPPARAPARPRTAESSLYGAFLSASIYSTKPASLEEGLQGAPLPTF